MQCYLGINFPGKLWTSRSWVCRDRVNGYSFLVQGHLDTYRFCDEVWTFLIKDVTFKLDNQTSVTADKVKIVSCNSKRPGEA